MKKWNKETVKLVLILVILIGVVTAGYFMYKSGELLYYNENAYVNKVANKRWYSVPNKDVYEMIEFTASRKINYVYYDKIDNVGTFSGCDSFIYTFKKEKFKAVCENNKMLTVEVLEYDNDRLVLMVNKTKHIYYSDLSKAME